MKRTVLVIDNDAASASTVSKVLEAEGYLVFTTSSGDASVTMAKKVTPLLVFLNLATPGTEGLEICKRLRGLPSLKDTPIVLLTLRDSKFDPRYKSLYGITGFLKKPLSKSSIMSALNSALPSASEAVTAAEAVAEPEAGGFSAPAETAPEYPGASFGGFSGGYEAPEEEPSDRFEPEPEPIEKKPSGFAKAEEEMPWEKENASAKADEFATTDFQGSGGFGAAEARPESEKYVPTRVDEGFRYEEQPFEAGEQKPYVTGRPAKDPGSAKKITIPAAISAVVLVLGVLAYIYLTRAITGTGRRPAATVVAKNMPSKPLKKPQPLGPLASITKTIAEAEAAIEPIAAPEKPAQEKPIPVIEALRPEKAAKPETKGVIYFVQFGAFSVEKNAEDFQKELKGKGIDASVHKGTAAGGQIFRVVAAKLDSKNEAVKLSAKIRSEKKIAAVVTKEGAEKPSGPVKKAVKEPTRGSEPVKEKGVSYLVQLGAFSVEKNAQDFQKELKDKGIEVAVYKGTSGGKTVYRVAAAKLSSRKAALELLEKMRAKNIQAVVTKETL